MSLVKRRENALFPGFNKFFDDFFDREFFDWTNSNFSPSGTTLPAVNIKETDKAFEVEMAAPGMKKEDFKVELHDNLLKISSEQKKETEEKEDDYMRREFSYQSFQRSFTLPIDEVDSDAIKATYKDGVLKLLIPRKEVAKREKSRLIKIS